MKYAGGAEGTDEARNTGRTPKEQISAKRERENGSLFGHTNAVLSGHVVSRCVCCPRSPLRMATQSVLAHGFAKWAPLFAHKPDPARQWATGNRHLSNQIQAKGSKRGLLYRGRALPTPQPQLFVPHYTLESAKKDGYEELQPEPLKSTFTRGDPNSIARLSHGLDVALRQPGIHFVKDPLSGDFNFPPYVGTLHQPDQVDYDRMPPFIPSSKDTVRNDFFLPSEYALDLPPSKLHLGLGRLESTFTPYLSYFPLISTPLSWNWMSQCLILTFGSHHTGRNYMSRPDEPPQNLKAPPLRCQALLVSSTISMRDSGL